MKWKKGIVALVGVLLVFGLGLWFQGIITPTSKTLEYKMPGTELVFLNNAYYRLLDPAGQEAALYHLPNEITVEMIGPSADHLAGNELEGAKLFVYMPPNGTANTLIYLLEQNEGRYRYLVFYCNMHRGGVSEETPDDLFALYSVDEAADVVEMICNDELVDEAKMTAFVQALFEAEIVHEETIVAGRAVYLMSQNGHIIYMNYDEEKQLVYWADTCFRVKLV